MLKYSELIAKLTDEQKIRILSGVSHISGKDMKNLGIPCVKSGNMKDYGRSVFPHTTSISHSWDTDLWSRIASAKAEKMAEKNVSFAIVPGAKIKLSPYRKETTEDPYLASLISAAYMKAASNAGLTTAASGYYVTESDTEWMDKEPDLRVLNEFITRPYARAQRLSSVNNVITDLRLSDTPYKDCCEYVRKVIAGGTEFFICEKANDDNTVRLISNGVVCLSASSNALIAASTRYRSLTKPSENGGESVVIQMEEELRNGTAISDESINSAVDKALDFIFKCKKPSIGRTLTEDNEKELSLTAILESTVLLKNRRDLLPFSTKSKIAIVDAFSPEVGDGDELANGCVTALAEYGYSKVRTIPVAQRDKVRAMCRKSDVTVLLLGAGHEAEKLAHKTEKLTLSPKQLLLAKQLVKDSHKTVAVIFSEHAPDINFTRDFDGVILAPLPITGSDTALAQILSGKYNPSGHLAYTLYSDTETSLKKGAAYIGELGMKAGPFIGYRYYDTAGLRVGYPFGHGLSYTEFKYSDLSVRGNEISFTVRNRGNLRGTEVAQIYVGINGSAVIRPKKELCGFARVTLAPREKKRVTLKIELPEVFYGGKLVTERGAYTVYVGASVSDIKLTGTLYGGNAQLKQDGERLSDYLQSYSNILNDNFTLEANYSIMKKGITNIVGGIVSIVLAISLAVFNTTMFANSLVLGVISGILAAAAIMFFIADVVERNRLQAANAQRIAEANEEHFEDAEQIPVPSTETMFKLQATQTNDEPLEVKKNEENEETSNYDYSEYVDSQFRIRDAVNEFTLFAAQRGYKLTRGTAENIISSFIVSKLLILNGLSSEEFDAFALMLSEYFGSAACLDTATPATDYEQSGNVYFGYDSEGYGTRKNVFKALGNAVNIPSQIHISAINGIAPELANDWLSPFMRYVSSPKEKNDILIADGSGRKLKYVITKNLWIIVRLSDNKSIEKLPMSVAKHAAVVPVFFTKCQVEDEPDEAQGFTSYQIDYMLEAESDRHDGITEENWKKIDKIESYAAKYTDYSIGNKLWLEIEKQMTMLLACDIEQTDAIDAVLATRVFPSVTVALKDKLDKEDKTVLQTAEFVLGADHVQYAKAYFDSLAIKTNAPEAAAVTENDSIKAITESSDLTASPESVMTQGYGDAVEGSVDHDESEESNDYEDNDESEESNDYDDIDETEESSDYEETDETEEASDYDEE